MENYEVIGQIGKGSFGIVQKIKRKSDGKILVWKEMNYGKMAEREKQQLVAEVNIIRELRHPNIVRYYDRIIDKKCTKIFLIMEYCEGGDMGSLLKKSKRENDLIAEDAIWKIFGQIMFALNECHNRAAGKILHRDLKPANIFFDAANNIKLGDFGLSREMGEHSVFATTNVGTPYYMSPEQIADGKYNEKSDIWSAGCLLYEMAALMPPFQARNQLSLAIKIKDGKFDRIPLRYSEDLQVLIESMLQTNPEHRPSVEQMIQLPVIKLRLKEKKFRDHLQLLKAKDEALKEKETQLTLKADALAAREKALELTLAAQMRISAEILELEAKLKEQQQSSTKESQQQQQQQQQYQLLVTRVDSIKGLKSARNNLGNMLTQNSNNDSNSVVSSSLSNFGREIILSTAQNRSSINESQHEFIKKLRNSRDSLILAPNVSGAASNRISASEKQYDSQQISSTSSLSPSAKKPSTEIDSKHPLHQQGIKNRVLQSNEWNTHASAQNSATSSEKVNTARNYKQSSGGMTARGTTTNSSVSTEFKSVDHQNSTCATTKVNSASSVKDDVRNANHSFKSPFEEGTVDSNVRQLNFQSIEYTPSYSNFNSHSQKQQQHQQQVQLTSSSQQNTSEKAVESTSSTQYSSISASAMTTATTTTTTTTTTAATATNQPGSNLNNNSMNGMSAFERYKATVLQIKSMQSQQLLDHNKNHSTTMTSASTANSQETTISNSSKQVQYPHSKESRLRSQASVDSVDSSKKKAEVYSIEKTHGTTNHYHHNKIQGQQTFNSNRGVATAIPHNKIPTSSHNSTTYTSRLTTKEPTIPTNTNSRHLLSVKSQSDTMSGFVPVRKSDSFKENSRSIEVAGIEESRGGDDPRIRRDHPSYELNIDSYQKDLLRKKSSIGSTHAPIPSSRHTTAATTHVNYNNSNSLSSAVGNNRIISQSSVSRTGKGSTTTTVKVDVMGRYPNGDSSSISSADNFDERRCIKNQIHQSKQQQQQQNPSTTATPNYFSEQSYDSKKKYAGRKLLSEENYLSNQSMKPSVSLNTQYRNSPAYY